MSRKWRAILLSVVGLLIVAGTMSLGSQLEHRFAMAQSAKSASEAQLTKWEYCVITDVSSFWEAGGNSKAIVNICYFRSSGCLAEKVEAVLYKTENPTLSQAGDNAVSKAIFKLSGEGWEMLGAGPFLFNPSKSQSLYFRRPKS
jgi:hypothetical protein